MSVCIVVPMKPPMLAKQRLSDALPADQREALALALFRHTLSFFRTHFSELDVLVVSEDDGILQLSHEFDCHRLKQTEPNGLNGALAQAAQWVSRKNYTGMFIVPSDIAFLAHNEVQMLLAEAEQHSVVMAVAKDGGTNALLVSPPQALEFQFGEQSALAHQRECAKKNLTNKPLTLPCFALDIDRLCDLQQAKRHGSEALKEWHYA